jgi:DNA invertase Pin-like site-specific DNA recombinase
MTGATACGKAVTVNRSDVSRRFIGKLTREQVYLLRQAGSLQLRAAGLTYSQIAQYFRVSDTAVMNWLNQVEGLSEYVNDDETSKDGI